VINSRITCWLNSRITCWLNLRITCLLNSRITCLLNSRITIWINLKITGWLNSRITCLLNSRITCLLSYRSDQAGCLNWKIRTKLPFLFFGKLVQLVLLFGNGDMLLSIYIIALFHLINKNSFSLPLVQIFITV
jgi:hypothetical protein